jgi:hypothetical protein
MRGILVAFVLLMAVSAVGCSTGDATAHVATMDASATKACGELRLLVQERAGLAPRDLQTRVGLIYADASASSNPVLKTRAVALYVDATNLAEGAEPGSFRQDLAAMEDACRA